MRKPRDEQWEDIVDTWYNHSEWGRLRKQRIAAFWICVGSGALIGTLLALLVR